MRERQDLDKRITVVLEGLKRDYALDGDLHVLAADGRVIASSAETAIGRTIGDPTLVGLPLSLLLNRKGADATVTMAHSRTADMSAVVREADIVIGAAGQAGMITGDMIKPGAAVLDVGVTRVDGGSTLAGDIHPDVASVAGWLSPNPGGVGPMTRAMLVKNVVEAASH